MIDWGNTPANSTASIYWPQVLAADVIATASALYSSHQLTASDPHTIQCPVTAGVTYVPIPQGTGQSLAGLLTVDVPPTVVAGQEFDVVLRRVRSRQPIQLQLAAEEPDEAEPPAAPARRARSRGRGTEGQLDTPITRKHHVPQETNWRYVTGAFQVKIPVSKALAILPQERDTLAIFRWRLLQTSPTSRWYPVLQRYVDLVAARVAGLGGDPGAIAPSPDGAPQPAPREAEPDHHRQGAGGPLRLRRPHRSLCPRRLLRARGVPRLGTRAQPDLAAGHAPPAPRHGHDLPGRTAPRRIGERVPLTAITARPGRG